MIIFEPIVCTEIPTGTLIHLVDQRDRELMEKVFERALNTWDGPPADLLQVYDQLKEKSNG